MGDGAANYTVEMNVMMVGVIIDRVTHTSVTHFSKGSRVSFV